MPARVRAASARLSRLGLTAVGSLLGGLTGGFLVVGVTLLLKAGIDYASSQDLRYIVLVPLLGLGAAVLVLHGHGKRWATDPESRLARAWRLLPHEAIRADINADVVNTAGEEEKFPWRMAPLRTAAIILTVGTGAAMGTEAPAAYLGEAAGVCLGDRGRRWRRLLRPAALAGGAAGVSALTGIALVGTIFMLELGRRRRAPLTFDRILAGLIGGILGWGIDVTFGLKLIRFVIPDVSPTSAASAIIVALLVGIAAGAVTAVAGLAIYNAKTWRASPLVRLAVGGAGAVLAALALAHVAAPTAAVGPGGGAIVWAQTVEPRPWPLLEVCLLRAGITVAAVAAGGCGGVFVPLLVVGDLAGRMVAPALGVGRDLAGAAGAASGIAGGYHLPLTAAAMVLGIGGPPRAILTCLLAVAVAARAGAAAARALELFWERLSSARAERQASR
jgi:H+/Cl- antiporter ClcA